LPDKTLKLYVVTFQYEYTNQVNSGIISPVDRGVSGWIIGWFALKQNRLKELNLKPD
jgi:hypothetical protein